MAGKMKAAGGTRPQRQVRCGVRKITFRRLYGSDNFESVEPLREGRAYAPDGVPLAAVSIARIDHMSIQVRDLPRSIAFYQKMFGLTVVSEDKPNEIVRLGVGKVLVSLHHKSPTGLVDHFAIGVEKFNQETVTRELKARGANPEQDIDAGFHIKDPQGIGVQIVGA